MNRNILIGIVVLLILGGVVSYEFYISNKKQVLDEYPYLIKIRKKIEDINYLQNKYKFNINFLKNYCNIKNLPTKYVLECNNLNKRKFLVIEEIFERAKLSKFSIDKKQNIDVFAEIIK